MRKSSFILTLFLCTGSLFGQTFKIENFHFKIDTTVESVIYLKDRFYCLTSNGDIFTIDTMNKKADVLTFKRNIVTLINVNDSLFGFTSTHDSLFWYNGSTFSFTRSQKINAPFFEDDDFIITKSCSGEWGGSVYFTDKRSGKKYECEATCPVIVNKKDGKYLVSASLAHLSGSTEIFEITDPTKLLEYNRDNLKGKQILHLGEDESHSKKGAKILIDSVGAFTITSFLYNNNVYHIVTDFEKTFLCRIENKSFKSIAKISDKSLWSYGHENFIDKTIGLVSFFDNYETSGFIWIRNNSIKVYRFDKE